MTTTTDHEERHLMRQQAQAAIGTMRAAQTSARDAQWSRWVSIAALFVSIVALVVSGARAGDLKAQGASAPLFVLVMGSNELLTPNPHKYPNDQLQEQLLQQTQDLQDAGSVYGPFSTEAACEKAKSAAYDTVWNWRNDDWALKPWTYYYACVPFYPVAAHN